MKILLMRSVENFNYQHAVSNTLRCFLYAESCLSGRGYIRRRSPDTNLVEIHEEMSKLLDKQVYVLNECFK